MLHSGFVIFFFKLQDPKTWKNRGKPTRLHIDGGRMGSGLVSVVQGPVTSMLVQFQVLPEFLQGFNLCTKGTALNRWLTKPDSSSTEAYRHRNVGRRTRETPVREVTLPLLSVFLVLLLKWKAPHSLFATLLPSSFPSSPMAMSSHGLNLCPQHSLISLSPRLLGCVWSSHQGQILLYEEGIFWFPAKEKEFSWTLCYRSVIPASREAKANRQTNTRSKRATEWAQSHPAEFTESLSPTHTTTYKGLGIASRDRVPARMAWNPGFNSPRTRKT